MKVKHTPGPWDVEHETEIIAAEGQRIAEADTRSINFVDGEANANAHLIAAAPDLLAACEAAKAIIDCICEEGEADLCVRCVLRAAIAKARGDNHG